MSELQAFTGETGHKYFTQMLNMAEDELDPFQYRLLAHYVRRAGHHGAVPESIADTAKACHMSEKKVRIARNELVEQGYIYIYEPTATERGAGISALVEVLDRWAENVARYSGTQPQGNMPQVTSVPQVNLPEVLPKAQAEMPEVGAKAQVNLPEKYLEELKDFKNPLQEPFAPLPPYPQPPPANGRARPEISPIQAEHDALTAAFGLQPGTLTPTADRLFWNAAGELRSIRFPVAQIPALHAYVADKARREKWSSTFGVNALIRYAPDYLRDTQNGSARASPSSAPPVHVASPELRRALETDHRA